jgi:hypothetical protein
MPSINLPFPGFYDSLYSNEIDHHQEQEAEWMAEREGENGVPPELRVPAEEFAELLQDHFDYRACCTAIAKAYVDAFSNEFFEATKIDLAAKFEEMTSPKFYNFETDRVFATVSDEVVAQMFARVTRESLRAVIEERHTSRSGFHSFYDNDIYAWLEKPITEWDHNELCTLLLAVLRDAKVSDFDWSVYYAVLDCDGIYHEYSEAVDWTAFEAALAELREEKLEALKADNPDVVLPPPRCPDTPDMFTGR